MFTATAIYLARNVEFNKSSRNVKFNKSSPRLPVVSIWQDLWFFVSYLCLDLEREIGHRDHILSKRTPNMLWVQIQTFKLIFENI